MGAHSAEHRDQPEQPVPSQHPVQAQQTVERAPAPASKNPWKRWRNQVPTDRRWQTLWIVVGLVAIVAAAACFTVGAQSRADSPRPDNSAVRAAVDGVTALMTFTPDDTAEQRKQVAEHLTGTIAADYQARGADVVFPNAVASKVSMKTTVSSAAPGESHSDFTTVLVFATQEIRVGDRGDYPDRVGIARWITVTKVEHDWRVSRVENISPQ